MKFEIRITYSKLFALLILIASVALDLNGDRSGQVLMFTIPFIVFLITGKQYFDRKGAK